MTKMDVERPAGVTMLVILTVIGGILAVVGLGGLGLLVGDIAYAAEFDLFIGGLSVVWFIIGFSNLAVGYGFWTQKKWAYQIALNLAIYGIILAIVALILMLGFQIAIIGIYVIMQGIIVYYLVRPEIREVFGIRTEWMTKELAAATVFGAAVAATTAVISIPIPATQGYINLGDTLVLTTALLFGWRVGALAGGVGSGLADIFLGYPHWAPFTLVIKGMEGLLAGYLRSTKETENWRNILAVIVGGMVMVAGYFLVEVPWYGLGAALTELPGNMFQAGSAMIFSMIIVTVVKQAAPELLLDEEEV